jgi:hypothetical protein
MSSGLAPSYRNPVPILDGNKVPWDITNKLPIPLERPVVGTAWTLGGLSVEYKSVVDTGANGGSWTLPLRLLLSGVLIDQFLIEFDAPANAVALPRRFADFHPYQPGFVIYDMSSLSFEFDVSEAGGTIPIITQNQIQLGWHGNVAYL